MRAAAATTARAFPMPRANARWGAGADDCGSAGAVTRLRRREEAHMDAKLWSDMFHLGVPVAEKVLRAVVVYAFLVVGLRLAGKRELAQLNPFDLVVLLTLSNTVQNAIIGDDNTVTGGLLGAATLLLVNYLVVRFLYDHRKLDQLVEGCAEILVQDGKVFTKK